MAKRTKSKPAAPAPSASSSSNDLSQIREIVQMMAGNDVSYFYSERNGAKLELRRGSDLEAVKELLKSLPASSGAPVAYAAAPAHAPAPAPVAPAPAAHSAAPAAAAPAAAAPEAVGPTINSPMVGTFYRSAAPGEKAFSNVGDHVDENTTVCIIEAMKVMNEIKPEGVRGTIARVLVEDGKPVQYGQPLFELKA